MSFLLIRLTFTIFQSFFLTVLRVLFNSISEEDSIARMRAAEEALAAKKKVSYQASIDFQCHFVVSWRIHVLMLSTVLYLVGRTIF